jgi:ATP-dependent Lon protease
MNRRNQDAVKKTAAGMLKLLYPHHIAGQVPRPIVEAVLRFATEMRKRVTDQLAAIKPTEFRDLTFDVELV